MPRAAHISRSVSDPQLLFVYGTLMTGQRLHKHLSVHDGVLLRGSAKIRGELYRPRGHRYPGAVPTTRTNRYVQGELYEIRDPEPVLKTLDRLEGLDEGLFVRRMVSVWQGAQKKRAWAYLYARPVIKADPIPNGRFASRAIAAGK